MPHTLEHKLSADDLLGLGEGGDIGILEALLLGQRFTFQRAADGSIFAADRFTGERKSGELSPAAPADPAKPNVTFFQDPNTREFFAFDIDRRDEDGNLVLQVISKEAPEIQRGFQHILEAALAVSEAGLNPLKYNFVFEDGRVFPKLIDQIPQTQDSFSTATGADGQLLAISRLTGTAIPIGATPKASDVPPDATVELDPVTKQFKVTQPNGQISFLQAPVDIKLPQEVTIGGQVFAFNPNTGGFQQVQVPSREFDPDVVTIDGRAFIQGPDGQLTPLGREEVPNLDELINERILSGDAPGALALADFRDRPTSLEAFNAAMQFAQSPGDVAAISAISRGQTLVQPPPTGTVQRIAEQPEFLQDAFQRLINQFRGGSGSPEEFIDVLTRINRENEELKGQTSELEKELATEQGKLDDLELEQKIEKLRQEFADALKERDTTKQKEDPDPSTAPTPKKLSPLEQRAKANGLSPEAQARHEEAIAVQRNQRQNRTFTADDLAAQAGFDAGLPPIDLEPPTVPQDFVPPKALPKVFELPEGISGEENIVPPPDPTATPVDPFVDAFKEGGTTHHPQHMEIVGEPGPDGKPNPELVELPPGTRVTPISKLSPAKIKKLKEMGIQGMQEGGIVEPLLPFGVRRALAGVTIEPTRRRLSRAAGLPVLSAQVRQNLLPEELEVFNRLSREAGIPEGAFRQEQESAFPGANLARGRARFAPRVLR